MANKQHLQRKLNELETYFPDREIYNSTISQVSIGWHLEHSFKLIHSVLVSLEASSPEDFTRKFNFGKWWFCGVLKRFPRGKAKSPKSLLPGEEITLEGLQEHLAKVKQQFSNFEKLPKEAHVKHPFFGLLDKKDSLSFLLIHTEHHLKIIRDIKKASV